MRIHHYEIESLLGKGATGEVYQALDLHLDRRVALKFLYGTDNFQTVPLFLREARIAAALTHPGIVTIHSIEAYRDRPFLVMEQIDGVPLHHLIDRHHEYSAEHLLDVVRQCCAALEYAHANNVIHRDIKPANVLIQRDGRVRICDFGLAKSLAEPTLTSTHTVKGTPLYMSPEQLRGDLLTSASDQYAVAVLAMQVLSGLLPFESDTLIQLANKILHDAPSIQALPAGVQPVFARAFSKDPRARFATCGAFFEALSTAVLRTRDAQVAAITRQHRAASLRRTWKSLATAFVFGVISYVAVWITFLSVAPNP